MTITKYEVRANMGLVTGKSLFFSKFKDAFAFAKFMSSHSTEGTLEIFNLEGKKTWNCNGRHFERVS
jgi:hypothetical protein